MTTEPVKVYELAKELGIDSISLLDKLKNLNIQVKNHMSELREEEAQLARTSLGKKPELTAKAPRKATAPKARKKAPESEEKKPVVAAEVPVTDSKKLSSPVLRRRVKADGATETVAHERGATGGSVLKAGEVLGTPLHETSPEGEEELSYHDSQMLEGEPGGYSAEEPGQQQFAASAEGEAVALASGATAEATGQSAPTRSPYVPPARPVAPRRSILKIVEPTAPPPKPMAPRAPVITPKGSPRPATTPGGQMDGFRIIKMTKENLDQMVEEEAAKKRGGGGREMEIRPEDVRFADYRKKEMVFLPKKKKLPVGKQINRTQLTEAKAQKRVVTMDEAITVQDLASQLSVKANELIRKLIQMGQMVNINSPLDLDTATLIAGEYKYEVRNQSFNEGAVIGETAAQDTAEDLLPRPPIVTIMGHVDHGKTTLLDAIREANVAAGEAGGITQHIGAYTVYPKAADGKSGPAITFIDTPGHEAFSVMRARGANVTDIVVLVVSADDGVMPQTREALSHAQAAKVPIIVAVNKIDKPGANPEKIKQGLAELNLLAEDWGGETMFIPVSALKKTNIDKLLDGILLQAEVLDLKGNPNAKAAGTVLEARLEKGRGPVVSVLVNRGTLRVGDAIVSGTHPGKVRALTDDKGRTVKEALPGFAVEILGFEGVPNAGEKFDATETEADARSIVTNRLDKARAKASIPAGKVSLEELFSKIKTGEFKELNVIVKADVFGSVEAIRDSLVKLSNDKVLVKVIHAAPGGVTESDVLLASASNALVIGFGVRPETKARQLAESEHVEIKSYQIIYELIDDVKKAMEGLLDKKKIEKFLGRAEVRQTFSVPKIGTIAGSSVVDGKIIRGANVRLLRDSRVIYEGKMSSLKRFKDDAKEVATGFECGIGIENYNDLKPGDIIEAFQIEMIAGTMDSP